MLFFQITGCVLSVILFIYGILHLIKNNNLKLYYNKKGIVSNKYYISYGFLSIIISLALLTVSLLSMFIQKDLIFAIIMASIILIFLLIHLLLNKKFQNFEKK